MFANPDYMELHEWADATMYIFQNYFCHRVLIGDDWQSWGNWVFDDPRLAKYNPPSPYEFQDWREWARRLPESFQNVSESPNSGGGGTPVSPLQLTDDAATQNLTDASGANLLTSA